MGTVSSGPHMIWIYTWTCASKATLYSGWLFGGMAWEQCLRKRRYLGSCSSLENIFNSITEFLVWIFAVCKDWPYNTTLPPHELLAGWREPCGVKNHIPCNCVSQCFTWTLFSRPQTTDKRYRWLVWLITQFHVNIPIWYIIEINYNYSFHETYSGRRRRRQQTKSVGSGCSLVRCRWGKNENIVNRGGHLKVHACFALYK